MLYISILGEFRRGIEPAKQGDIVRPIIKIEYNLIFTSQVSLDLILNDFDLLRFLLVLLAIESAKPRCLSTLSRDSTINVYYQSHLCVVGRSSEMQDNPQRQPSMTCCYAHTVLYKIIDLRLLTFW